MAQHPPLGLELSVGAYSGLWSSISALRISSPAVLGCLILSLSIVWDLGSDFWPMTSEYDASFLSPSLVS